MSKATFFALLLLMATNSGSTRTIKEHMNLISDGTDHKSNTTNMIDMKLEATSVTCTPVYDFLPCTTVVWGQLFLIVVYEYLISLGEGFVSSGSDLMFQLLGPGIFGASTFHLLGTIPEVVLVLVSGLTASTDSAEEQAEMSMALLAGSAVMLLTLIWGACVASGSYDISQSSSSSSLNIKKLFSLDYGIQTDNETRHTARIMIVSLIPFLILQLPKIIGGSCARIAILVALIISVALLCLYILYQIFQPWLQTRRFEFLIRRYFPSSILQNFLTSKGIPDESLLRNLFKEIDQNNDTQISVAELRALILGIELEEVGLKSSNFVENVLKQFDISGDARISETEFVNGLSKWVSDTKASFESIGPALTKFFSRSFKKTEEEHKKVLTQRKSSQTTVRSWWNFTKATFLLVLGTAILSFLTLPLMESISEFASDINISSFAISYVIIPLALNSREAISMITTIRQKNKKDASLTLSEMYGAVFMNNMMGLTMFLLLVYIRDLSWDFSAEVLVVLIICAIMGIYSSISTKFPFWSSIIAFLLYPSSLLIIYILTAVFGWS
ncbi:Sodium/calcium exchanger membrane region [Dillenia turbinata]|uniref:Sodium/calcium exchanger membrane region n=1 Tax=Dillenia turbinata TaxID=194707 RepID=A0AAN8UXJ7_9MAGN